MPTYMCYAHEGQITAEQKSHIAAGIARIHSRFTGAPAAPHPLAAFIFSRNQGAIDRFIRELTFGGGAVNQVNVHLMVESMPFGGVGMAGMGHYYGKYGFDMLTHAKSVLISPPDVAIEHLFPPYSPAKNADLKVWFEY